MDVVKLYTDTCNLGESALAVLKGLGVDITSKEVQDRISQKLVDFLESEVHPEKFAPKTHVIDRDGHIIYSGNDANDCIEFTTRELNALSRSLYEKESTITELGSMVDYLDSVVISLEDKIDTYLRFW